MFVSSSCALATSPKRGHIPPVLRQGDLLVSGLCTGKGGGPFYFLFYFKSW